MNQQSVVTFCIPDQRHKFQQISCSYPIHQRHSSFDLLCNSSKYFNTNAVVQTLITQNIQFQKCFISHVNPSSAPLLQKIQVTMAVLKQWTFQELSVTLSALKTSKTRQTGTCIFLYCVMEKANCVLKD